MKIAAIDFETANSSPASVCSVGVCSYIDGEIVEELSTLIQPGESVSHFSYWNIQIHGIHAEDVVNAPTFAEVYPRLEEIFNGALVTAYNARFDMGCIKAACDLYNLPVPRISYFDTLQLAQRAVPQLPHHGLADMCEYYDIHFSHHQADEDAYACLAVMLQIMGEEGIANPEELLQRWFLSIRKLR